MTVIDSDVEAIIDEEVDNMEMRQVIREVLQWQEDRVHAEIRQNKNTELDAMIQEYIADTGG